MTVEASTEQGTDTAGEAFHALDRAFECWHDGNEEAARRHLRTAQSWLEEAEAAGIDEDNPRLFELVEEVVRDLLLEDWSGAAARLDELERRTALRA